MFKSAYITIILTLFLVGCGKEKKSGSDLSILKAEYDKRVAEYYSKAGVWPSDYDCDAMLWAGVAARAGLRVDLKAGLTGDGRPMRKPYKDCQVPEESKASTSNDMITGLLLGLNHQKDTHSLDRLYRYGTSQGWVMGYPGTMLARVYLRPNGQALLAKAIFKQSGVKFPQADWPVVYTPMTDTDYPAHLQYLSAILAKDLGTFTYLNDLVVSMTASNGDGDALGQAAIGDFEHAEKLLLSDYVYPTYVRGADIYKHVHWLLAAKLVIEGSN